MLFNSTEFIFQYLPVVLIGFFWLARISHRIAAFWLGLASLFFYGCWNPKFVALLLASIVFNYLISQAICNSRAIETNAKKAKRLLIVALIINLALLGYFKYTNFFITTLNILTGNTWNVRDIILPLGISFFTFTQIAFLVDSYRGIANERNFIHYLLFVTYFPHLIAGPVLHHKEMMPQFGWRSTYRFSYENLSIGVTIFCIGLFKKVVIADNIGQYVGPVFSAPASGITLGFIEAWSGALCYTFQLYFDFSGYSDMAIGLSRMLGVALPLNFNSPYKSANIIEFWRNWHMTLSRFLKDYLYIPLGGNRKGSGRRYLNLTITMLLGGLWHGAGWTYIAWGGLHGIYLAINHAWQNTSRNFWPEIHNTPSRFIHAVSVLLTFLAVVLAWVIFRSDNMEAASAILAAMLGLNGISFISANSIVMNDTIAMIVLCLLISWFAPNTQEIMGRYKPALNFSFNGKKNPTFWSPTIPWAFLTFLLGFSSLLLLSEKSPFLYFQF